MKNTERERERENERVKEKNNGNSIASRSAHRGKHRRMKFAAHKHLFFRLNAIEDKTKGNVLENDNADDDERRRRRRIDANKMNLSLVN
jgi:hypothetical protein